MQLTVSGVKKEYEEGITLPKLFEIENVETPEYVTVYGWRTETIIIV